MRKCLFAAVIGFGSVASAVPADASIILSLVGNPVAATVGGTVGFDYTYSATLSSDEQLSPGTSPVFFTLYDFGQGTLVGETGDLTTASGWSYTLNQNFTTYAQAVQPNNNASIDDVRATYTGAGITGGSLSGQPGDLGTFTLFTTSRGPYAIFADDQDAQLEKYSPGTPTNNTVDSNIASVAVPTLGRSVTVPEPASLAMLGAGLAGLALKRRPRAAV